MIKVLVYTEVRALGGVTTFVRQLSADDALFRSHGIELFFCTDKNNPIKPGCPEGTHFLDIEINELQYKRQFRNPVLRKAAHLLPRALYEAKQAAVSGRNRRKIREYLRDGKFDCIIGNSGGYVDSPALTVLEEGKKLGIPVRIFLSHSYPAKYDGGAADRFRFLYADRRISRNSTNIVTVSEFSAAKIRAASRNRQIRVDVIYNGLDKARDDQPVAQKRARLLNGDDTRKGCRIVGQIGLFSETKGQLYFLEAMNKIKAQNGDDIVGVIIGNIYEKHYYERCVEFLHRQGLDKDVYIKTDIYNAAAYMDGMDLLILPSVIESFGLAAIEAMQRGVPVVAFRTGGLPEVVEDGVTGELVDCFDTDGLAAKAVALLNDPDRYERYSRNGIERADAMFSGDAMRRNYIAYIEQCVSKRTADARLPKA